MWSKGKTSGQVTCPTNSLINRDVWCGVASGQLREIASYRRVVAELSLGH
jgi:hypothetical protein